MLEPGEALLLHSDGVTEAHATEREMFGFPRLHDVVGARAGSGDVIERVLAELDRFTADGWEQEDDITLVAITRRAGGRSAAAGRRDVVLDPERRPATSGGDPSASPRRSRRSGSRRAARAT